jgi:hypothetical protein
MISKLYLGDAFGWETESTAMVAISQLREESKIDRSKCPKAQLIKNGSVRWQPNVIKILGYIPAINVLAGAIALAFVATSHEDESVLRPHHKTFWILRSVCMIFTGPLLFIVDLIKHIFDSKVVSKYNRDNREAIEKFNTSHEHSSPPWPLHPVDCLKH